MPKKFEIWNDGLLVEVGSIFRVIDNGEGWLKSDYEPEEIFRQHRGATAGGENLDLYDWLFDCGMAIKPEFFFSNEDVTIISTDGEVFGSYKDAIEGIEDYPAITDKKGQLVFMDQLVDECECDLEIVANDGRKSVWMGKLSDGRLLIATYDKHIDVNDHGVIVGKVSEVEQCLA